MRAPFSSLPQHQRGALFITFALMLLVMLGLFGMALDVAMMYNRKAELQNLADSVALAAAQRLTGKAEGVEDAAAQAAAIAVQHKYQYSTPVVWNERALSFAASADSAAWVSLAAARAAPATALFARVDTGELGQASALRTFFMRLLGPGLAQVSVAASAVAGRTMLQLTPLAVCAMSTAASAERQNPGPGGTVKRELVEYGFRRGVGYNLLNLNPYGSAPANFVLNPIDPFNTPGNPSNLNDAVVLPFVCSGAIPQMAARADDMLNLAQPFPASLIEAFNTRFDLYGSLPCSPRSAPPDANIRQYNGKDSGNEWWMTNLPAGQSAAATAGSPLRSVADLPPPVPASLAAPAYGPLWSYSRAVEYAAAEPGAGYQPFGRDSWPVLYAGAPAPAANLFLAASYSPYDSPSGKNFMAPSQPGLRGRRVLNVPLLACPVSGSQGRLLAVGRFFMTAQASAGALHAEFAGLADAAGLGRGVELFQ